MTLYDEINSRPYTRRGLPVPSWPLEKAAASGMITRSDIRSAARIALRSLHDAEPAEKAAFAAMLARPDLSESHLKLAKVVFTALGRIISESMEKRAEGGPVAWLPGALTEAAKGTALLGLLGGSLLGGGAWAARRGLSIEDEGERRLEVQRDTYQRMASEIRAELVRRKLKQTPENVAAVVDYLT